MPAKQCRHEKQSNVANSKKTRQIFCWPPQAEQYLADNYSPRNCLLRAIFHRAGQIAVSQFLPGPFPRRLLLEAIIQVVGPKPEKAWVTELEEAFLALPFIQPIGEGFAIEAYSEFNGSAAHHLKRAEAHKLRKAQNLVDYRKRLKS